MALRDNKYITKEYKKRQKYIKNKSDDGFFLVASIAAYHLHKFKDF